MQGFLSLRKCRLCCNVAWACITEKSIVCECIWSAEIWRNAVVVFATWLSARMAPVVGHWTLRQVFIALGEALGRTKANSGKKSVGRKPGALKLCRCHPFTLHTPCDRCQHCLSEKSSCLSCSLMLIRRGMFMYLGRVNGVNGVTMKMLPRCLDKEQ